MGGGLHKGNTDACAANADSSSHASQVSDMYVILWHIGHTVFLPPKVYSSALCKHSRYMVKSGCKTSVKLLIDPLDESWGKLS